MQPVDDQVVIATLKKHSAYVTQNRIAVLKVLLQSRTSINVSRIRKLSPVVLDRISVYRTIQFFLRKGLIQTIPNSKGIPQYILSDFLKSPPLNMIADQLVYFICNDCGHTELVEQNAPLVIRMPDHQVNNYYIVLEGLCSNCKEFLKNKRIS